MNTTSQTSGNGLIDISGLCDPENATEVMSQYPYWKQMDLSESLEIPIQKPDAEQINSVVAAVSIIRSTVIVTPRSYIDAGPVSIAEPNLEGRLLTGRKLIVEGQICQQIEYTSTESSQPVHSVEFFVPFSSYIVVPLTLTIGGREVDALDVNFDVNACLEDIQICLLDERRILKQVTLMLYATPTGLN